MYEENCKLALKAIDEMLVSARNRVNYLLVKLMDDTQENNSMVRMSLRMKSIEKAKDDVKMLHEIKKLILEVLEEP